MRKLLWILLILVVIVAGLLIWHWIEQLLPPKPGTVKDEALAAGRLPESFPAADEDYFRDMDYGATKNPEAMRVELDKYLPHISAEDAVKHVVKGRNNWIVWTGGNDYFWDKLSKQAFNTLDLLRTISSHPSMKYGRHNRWYYLGVVNEPCYNEPKKGRADRYGLWLDERDPACGPDPFENEQKYPGVKIGARGKNMPVGSYYGYGTGIIGLRLFPNPAFDEEAAKKWNADKYYTDSNYYNQKDLIKPYRVGMSCAFCHVGPNPTNPPEHPEHPTFANLNSNPGAQYFWTDRILVQNPTPDSFVAKLIGCSRPGALDTSFVSSDQINNPRTMNAVYNVGARMEIAKKWHMDHLEDGERDNKQFNDYVPPGTPLTQYYDPKNHDVWTPRVLKDGSDSVGVLGALNRVYINIGLFSEEWTLHFTPLVGGTPLKPITPIKIAIAQKNSTWWNANVDQTPDVALFFLATAKPDLLKNAPGSAQYLAATPAQLTRGKEVFAERCARCHSSKQPEKAFTTFFQPGCNGPKYLQCWNDYWAWTKTAEYKDAIKPIVMAPDFLDNNFLSTDLRVPVTLLETNACSPLATNALAGDTWSDFASSSYKSLPSVGTIYVHHPLTGERRPYQMPAGGRGYTRPASLISLWSTAPFLLNNSVGPFMWSGSVADRMTSFDQSIKQMLWPEKRDGDRQYVTASGKSHPGIIDVTPVTNPDGSPAPLTYLSIPAGFLPPELSKASGFISYFLPNVFHQGGLKVGPIPRGTPINLLADMNLMDPKTYDVVPKIIHDLKALGDKPTNEEATKQFLPLVPKMLEVCKCPDFVINRGHYFGTDYLPQSEGEPGLSDDDKNALIEFLKTF